MLLPIRVSFSLFLAASIGKMLSERMQISLNRGVVTRSFHKNLRNKWPIGPTHNPTTRVSLLMMPCLTPLYHLTTEPFSQLPQQTFSMMTSQTKDNTSSLLTHP